jgi:hypothetical protein
MNPKPEEVDILEVMDRVLSAALREVRTARARAPADVPPVAPSNAEIPARKSQTQMCIYILTETGRPLHVTALLDALHAHGVTTTRESLVSAISKKIHPLGRFVRTGPNTFGLAGRDSAEP